MRQITSGFACIIALKTVLGANILYVAHLASQSHYLWNKALSLALVERGHNLTIVTHNIEKNATPENYTIITLENIHDILHKYYNFEEAMHQSVLSSFKSGSDYVRLSCEHDLNTKGLQTLLNYPKDIFDLILFDVTCNQCFYPLIKIFGNPPVVAVTPFLLPPYLSNSFGNHLHISYIPYINSVFTNEMTLIERVLNFVYTNLDVLYRDYIACSSEYNLAKKRFGGDIDPFEEVECKMSILLANTDPNIDYPISLPPNIIPVGGLHIKPAIPLPNDIKKIVDEAKDGIILFSLGTNIKFSMLTSKQKKALFTALEKFPQTVLWKIEIEIPKDLPKNVVARKWLPQNDILGHPNTRLFMSHGGALSTQEAIYHGVPVVTIPFLFDQFVNSRKFAERKFGKHLDHQNLTTENVYEAVKEVLENPIYRKNIEAISKRYRDQPETAMERGIFWIEYILRHKRAENLVTPARYMPFYKTLNLDALLVFAIGLFCVYNCTILILTAIRLAFGFGRNT